MPGEYRISRKKSCRGPTVHLTQRRWIMSEKIWHLKQCDLFRRLSAEQLAQLELQSRIRHFPRKSLLYIPSDQGDGVLLLASGRVKICTLTDDGKEVILTFIEPGELFGELAVLDADSRDEYAEAYEQSTVIFIPAEAMHRLMDENSHITVGITKLIGFRRRRVERRLKNLLFRSNRDRLIHALLDLAEQYGRRSETGIELQLRLSHQDLANMIGSTRESVTLALGELQAEGLIRIQRRKITVAAPERLAHAVHCEFKLPADEQLKRALDSRRESGSAAKIPPV